MLILNVNMTLKTLTQKTRGILLGCGTDAYKATYLSVTSSSTK